MTDNNFFIIGNGGGGTSLLRGLLNAHTDIECLFEDKASDVPAIAYKIEYFERLAEECTFPTWGNKIPVEAFISTQWTLSDLLELASRFKIVHIVRRYSMYSKRRSGPYLENWMYSQQIYWDIREAHPEGVIQVNFEDLLLRTEAELKRVCHFLGVAYQSDMIRGTLDTGYDVYNQKGVNKSRV